MRAACLTLQLRTCTSCPSCCGSIVSPRIKGGTQGVTHQRWAARLCAGRLRFSAVQTDASGQYPDAIHSTIGEQGVASCLFPNTPTQPMLAGLLSAPIAIAQTRLVIRNKAFKFWHCLMLQVSPHPSRNISKHGVSTNDSCQPRHCRDAALGAPRRLPPSLPPSIHLPASCIAHPPRPSCWHCSDIAVALHSVRLVTLNERSKK